MKAVKTKITIGVLSTLIAYVSLNSIFHGVWPSAFVWQDEDREEAQWVATSRSWLDQKTCRWLGLCGLSHVHFAGPTFGRRLDDKVQQPIIDDDDWDWQDAWSEGKDRPEDWTDDERVLREIPEYVLEYAPYVHLFSGEQFWPGDISEHLYHITPHLNYTPLSVDSRNVTLQTLDKLNQWERGRNVFLKSNDNVEERPEWLEGEKNIPVAVRHRSGDSSWTHTDGRHFEDRLPIDDGKEEWEDVGSGGPRALGGGRYDGSDEDSLIPMEGPEGDDFVTESDQGSKGAAGNLARQRRSLSLQARPRDGRSNAPAILIVVNKGHGVVDAFWFFFYSFNRGNVVFNVRFGNHVGDWEHSAVRFQHGNPKAVYVSEHNFGSSYAYDAVEKIGKRPVVYSATGTHAMYATRGTQAYVLPWGVLHDETDRGPLWDPTLNLYGYTYDYVNDTLRSSNLSPQAPTEWFFFAGHWGDKYYPLSDSRQYRFAGQYHYVNGPLGPRFKNLGRSRICPGAADPCVSKSWLSGSSRRMKRWQGVGEGEEMSPEDEERFLGNHTATQEVTGNKHVQ